MDEKLNDGYEAKIGDKVRPLSFVSSNRVDWKTGTVVEVLGGDLHLPEVAIDTDLGKRIIEYSYYVELVPND